jgi:hypothetical protein
VQARNFLGVGRDFGLIVKDCIVSNYFLITYLLTAWSRALLEKITDFQPVQKYPAFMEPEASLPHTQVPATCPYPEPAASSPYPHILLPEDPS